MDRNVLNDIVNILCANIEKVHGVIITNGGVITNAYGMNKYEYLDRIVFSNEYMNIEYKDIKSITIIGNVVRNQANQISEADRYYNNVVARSCV